MSFPHQHQQPNPYGTVPMYGGPPPPNGYPPGAPPNPNSPNTVNPPTHPMAPMSAMPFGAAPPPQTATPHLPGYPSAPSTPYPSPYSPYPMQPPPSFQQQYPPPSTTPTPSPFFAGHSPYMPHQTPHQQTPPPSTPQQPPSMYPHPQQPHPFPSAQPANFYGHHGAQQQPPYMMPGVASGMHNSPGMYGGFQQQAQHPATIGVQLDGHGLPLVPGDMGVTMPMKLRVEEKIVSATRDSFTVLDQSGAIRYKVDGIFSINERKIMKDVQGNILLKLREARLKLRDKITIFNSMNVPLLTLQKASAFQIGTKRVHGYLGGRATGTPAIVITGNANNTHFHVSNAQKMEIAEITRRKFSLKNMLTDQDTYDVTIHHGCPSLLSFITVALDEIYED